MAVSTCLKCAGHSFELAPFTPLGVSLKLTMVQCSGCGKAKQSKATSITTVTRSPAALFEYYAECLTVEERVDASSSFDGVNKRFIAARLANDWWPNSGQITKLYAPVSLRDDI
jgi:hypothetical protein